ncbi:MAG: M48 family metalloprotease [Treponema sp.]|jgi:predicted Zn-dependent protease|nr:M48 family metalloprotease [Treponema sp.]
MKIGDYRNRIPAFFLSILTLWGCALFFSCETLAEATGLAAQAAGEAGYIPQEMARKIVEASADTVTAANKAAEEITPDQAYYIGRSVGANILTRYKLDLSEPELIKYLNKIAGALAANSPLRSDLNSAPHMEPFNGYHVGLLDSQEINAFATSGGHIFITRGFLACAKSEDDLAAIIAHELAHIQLQHNIGAIKNSRETEKFFSGLKTAAVIGSSFAELITQKEIPVEITEGFEELVNVGVTLLLNGYSQAWEFNADALALVLLASAGYEPSSLVDMLKALERVQPGSPGGLNVTHPTPAARISNAESAIGGLRVADTGAFRRSRFNAATGAAIGAAIGAATGTGAR